MIKKVLGVTRSWDKSCKSNRSTNQEEMARTNLPICETAVTLRVLRNLRSRATNAEGAAAVALVKLVR